MSKKKRGIDAYNRVSQAKENTQKTESTEGFIKEASGEAQQGYRKAAHFLMLLGKDEAAKVLKHLDQREVENIAHEIASTKKLDTEEAKRLLNEFGMKRDTEPSVKGGREVAKSILVNAFGEEQGNTYFEKAVPKEEYKPFQFLEDYEVGQLKMLLKDESDYVISVILAYLDPGKASELLGVLPSGRQKDIITRIAKMKKIDNDVLERMENSLREKIRRQGKVETREVDGTSALAEILKHMDISTEQSILEQLDDYDKELTHDIKEKLFSIEDVLSLRSRELQKVLRDFEDNELALVLKGKDEAIREKLLENVSGRRRKLIEEELDALGPRKKSEIEDATKEFLHYIRDMIEEGKINPPQNDEGVIT